MIADLSSPSSFVTPLGEYVLPWDERATGAGLVQGLEAIAATPTAFVHSSAGRPGWHGDAPSSAAGMASVRVLTRIGSTPVEFELRGFSDRACAMTLFDVHGRLVRRWTSYISARAVWDGTLSDGSRAASGVYFVYAQGEGLRSGVKFLVAR